MVTKGESLNTTAESFTEQVPNLFQLKYESEKKRNQVLDVLQENLNREEIDDKNTSENSEETTTMNRRLPEFYPGIQRKKTTVPTSTKPQVINHNMNLQTALIINTLSKVLPNVPQSRLKNQPRLENVSCHSHDNCYSKQNIDSSFGFSKLIQQNDKMRDR